MSDGMKQALADADQNLVRFRKAPKPLFQSDEERRAALKDFEQQKFTRLDYAAYLKTEMQPIVGDIMVCGEDSRYREQLREHRDYLRVVMKEEEDPAFRAIARATFAYCALRFVLVQLEDEYLTFPYIEAVLNQKLEGKLLRRSNSGRGKRLFGHFWEAIPEIRDLPIAKEALDTLDAVIKRAEKVRKADERKTCKEWTDAAREEGYLITLPELLAGKDGRCPVKLHRVTVGDGLKLHFATLFYDAVGGQVTLIGAFQAASRSFRRFKLDKASLPLSALTAPEFSSTSGRQHREREQLVWELFRASLESLKSTTVVTEEAEDDGVDPDATSEFAEESTMDDGPPEVVATADPLPEPEALVVEPVVDPVPVPTVTQLKCLYDGCPDTFETKPKRAGHMAHCKYKK